MRMRAVIGCFVIIALCWLSTPLNAKGRKRQCQCVQGSVAAPYSAASPEPSVAVTGRRGPPRPMTEGERPQHDNPNPFPRLNPGLSRLATWLIRFQLADGTWIPARVFLMQNAAQPEEKHRVMCFGNEVKVRGNPDYDFEIPNTVPSNVQTVDSGLFHVALGGGIKALVRTTDDRVIVRSRDVTHHCPIFGLYDVDDGTVYYCDGMHRDSVTGICSFEEATLFWATDPKPTWQNCTGDCYPN